MDVPGRVGAGAGGSGLRIAHTGRGLAEDQGQGRDHRVGTRADAWTADGSGYRGDVAAASRGGKARVATPGDRGSQVAASTRSLAVERRADLSPTFIPTYTFLRQDASCVRILWNATVLVQNDGSDTLQPIHRWRKGRNDERGGEPYRRPSRSRVKILVVPSERSLPAGHVPSRRSRRAKFTPSRPRGGGSQIRVSASSRRINAGSCSCAMVATAGSSPSLM